MMLQNPQNRRQADSKIAVFFIRWKKHRTFAAQSERKRHHQPRSMSAPSKRGKSTALTRREYGGNGPDTGKPRESVQKSYV